MAYKDRKCERAVILNVLYLIRRRCYNASSREYKWYGGRGIKVCDEWMNDSNAFYNWAKSHGYREGLQIDRIDNDGDYSPTNCRFVDCKTNMNNRRNTMFCEIDGVVRPFAEWCQIYNVSKPETIRRRIKKMGWTAKEAFERPIKHFSTEADPDVEWWAISDISKKYGISKMSIYSRLRRGYTLEQCINFDKYRKRAPKREKIAKDEILD